MHIPTEPGDYFWTEWQAMVRVYGKGGTGKRLYVKPPCPGAIEIRITPRIAGKFLRRLDQYVESKRE